MPSGGPLPSPERRVRFDAGDRGEGIEGRGSRSARGELTRTLEPGQNWPPGPGESARGPIIGPRSGRARRTTTPAADPSGRLNAPGRKGSGQPQAAARIGQDPCGGNPSRVPFAGGGRERWNFLRWPIDTRPESCINVCYEETSHGSGGAPWGRVAGSHGFFGLWRKVEQGWV